MHEDLLVLLVPVIHAIPVEGEVVLDLHRLRIGILVAPDSVLGHPVANLYRPVAGIALERAVGRMRRALQQVHAHVGPGKVVDGNMAGLEQQLSRQ